MSEVATIRHDLIQDRQDSMFVDVLSDSEQSFDAVTECFICGDRQRPMQDSQTHHEQVPVTGVVREFEADLPVDVFFSSKNPHGAKRSRQVAVPVTRATMKRHSWKQNGKKSSLWAFEHRWPQPHIGYSVKTRFSDGTLAPAPYSLAQGN
jgi:hypothetical protein